MKACRGSRSIAPRMPNLGTKRGEWSVLRSGRFTALKRGVAEPQSPSESFGVEINALLSGFEPAIPTTLSRLYQAYILSKILVTHIIYV